MMNIKNLIGAFCVAAGVSLVVGILQLNVRNDELVFAIVTMSLFITGAISFFTGIILWCIPSAERIAEEVAKELKG